MERKLLDEEIPIALDGYDSDSFSVSSEESNLSDIQALEDEYGDLSNEEHMSDLSTWFSSNDEFCPKTFNFPKEKGGLKANHPLLSETRESDFLKFYITDDFLNNICEESVRYHRQKNVNKLRDRNWFVTPKKLLTFFALSYAMPLMKKGSIKEYWKTNTVLSTPKFASAMSQTEFLSILRYLHFSNNEKKKESSRPTYKLGNIINYLKKKTSEIFYPHQKLVIDESLILFKGRLAFRQYIPTKRKRFGLKTFVICDCQTGIVLDILLYTGKNTEIDQISSLGFSGSVVHTLMDPYLDMDHILYIDNWYSSPTLAKYLLSRSTGVCGTAKVNRKGMPKFKGM